MVKPNFSTEFHIKCDHCQTYSSTTCTTSPAVTKCVECQKILTTSASEYFIYIPIRQQLLEVVNKNCNEIISYQSECSGNEKFISDVHHSIQFKQTQNRYKQAIILSLVVGTDGVVVHKRSNKSLWAIQLYQNYIHPKKRYMNNNILVAGLYHGKPDMKEFFLPLMKELQSIHQAGGISIFKDRQEHIFLPVILHCCCDLPAKVEVQGMVNHNAYNACGYCTHPGESIKSTKNSKSFVRYVSKEDIPLRTHQKMLSTYKRVRSKPIDGIKTVSC